MVGLVLAKVRLSDKPKNDTKTNYGSNIFLLSVIEHCIKWYIVILPKYTIFIFEKG